MLKRIVIKNFQSHSDTTLDFDKGVNVITGSSDSGKSAIIRALRWVLYNKPAGDSYRSYWAGKEETRVELHFKHMKVIRTKTKSSGSYELRRKGKKPIIFKAFGKNVPEEIIEALNLNDINLQNQMDAPFLLSNSSAEVSRHFNKIANIDQIDTSLSKMEGWIRGTNQDLKAAKDEVNRFLEQEQEFEYLDDLETEVEVAEQMNSRLSSTRTRMRTLNGNLMEAERLEDLIQKNSAILKAEEDVDTALARFNIIDQKKHDLSILENVIEHYEEIQEEIEEAEVLTEAEDLINQILALYSDKEKIDQKADDLEEKIGQANALESRIKQNKKDLKNLNAKWEKHAPEICPLCGNKIKKK